MNELSDQTGTEHPTYIKPLITELGSLYEFTLTGSGLGNEGSYYSGGSN